MDPQIITDSAPRPVTAPAAEPAKKAKRRICNLRFRGRIPSGGVKFADAVSFDPVTKLLPKDYFAKWRKRCRITHSFCRCTPVAVLQELLGTIPEECAAVRLTVEGLIEDFGAVQEPKPEKVVKAFKALVEALLADDLVPQGKALARYPHLKSCPGKDGSRRVLVGVPIGRVWAVHTKVFAPGEKVPPREDLVDEALDIICSREGATHNVYEDVPVPVEGDKPAADGKEE